MSRDILTRTILPAACEHAVSQARPVVVVVAGQPGAGKTQIADLVLAALERRGGAVRVCRDLFKSAHLRYQSFLAADVRTAGVRVRPDTARWQAGVEAHVREGRFDAVVESALADPDEFRSSIGSYRRFGYRIEVVALATAEALSQLGILDRFVNEAAAGGGRYVSWQNHDTCASGMLRTLAVIETEQLADRVTVIRRDGSVLYTTELTLADGWRRHAVAAGAVRAERARPWTARETALFRRELARTDRRVDRLASEDRRLAVQRDSERAAAWSEPVRRIAQPISAPPGVNYHRLSHEEHRWIFENLIVPSYLDDVAAQDEPVATYVLGQPGAGKWRVANVIKRAMRYRGVIRLSGDDFKMTHPDYLQLLQEDPRGAGAAIRADYRAWMAQAEGYVRQRRGDVLIEASPGSSEEFWSSALAFAEAGYRIELVVLAVREPDSRQGTAHRYALMQKTGVPARFTSRTGHDICYRALPGVVRGAEASSAVASIRVLRRDFTALYGNQRGTSGAWTDPARASLVLAVERQRLYTLQEATQFLHVHQQLVTALPQHRRELEEIAARARRFLPESLRPRPLAPPVFDPSSLPACWATPSSAPRSGPGTSR